MRIERITDAFIIPRRLVEQLKDRDFELESFYEYMKLVEKSPLCLLYIIMDDKYDIRGFIYGGINALDMSLFIDFFSLDKDYWGNKEIVGQLFDEFEKIISVYKFKKIYMSTSKPAFFMEHGFKESKLKLLEMNMEERDGR